MSHLRTWMSLMPIAWREPRELALLMLPEGVVRHNSHRFARLDHSSTTRACPLFCHTWSNNVWGACVSSA